MHIDRWCLILLLIKNLSTLILRKKLLILFLLLYRHRALKHVSIHCSINNGSRCYWLWLCLLWLLKEVAIYLIDFIEIFILIMTKLVHTVIVHCFCLVTSLTNFLMGLLALIQLLAHLVMRRLENTCLIKIKLHVRLHRKFLKWEV